MVRGYQGRRWCTRRRDKAHALAGARIDRLNLTRLLDCHMHETTHRIEERRIGRSRKSPFAAEFPRFGAHRDKRATIAGGIKTLALMIDVEPMGAW